MERKVERKVETKVETKAESEMPGFEELSEIDRRLNALQGFLKQAKEQKGKAEVNNT